MSRWVKLTLTYQQQGTTHDCRCTIQNRFQFSTYDFTNISTDVIVSLNDGTLDIISLRKKYLTQLWDEVHGPMTNICKNSNYTKWKQKQSSFFLKVWGFNKTQIWSCNILLTAELNCKSYLSFYILMLDLCYQKYV